MLLKFISPVLNNHIFKIEINGVFISLITPQLTNKLRINGIANKINGINKTIISVYFIFFIYNIYPSNKTNIIGKII